MHRTPLSPAHRRLFAVALALALLGAGLVAAGVAAASSPEPVAEESGAAVPAASPSPEPSPEPTTITCRLSPATVVFGGAVTASGVVTPAAEGTEVAIALGGVRVATVLTDASGAYSLKFTPRRGGSVVARVVADGAGSEPQALAVKTRVGVTHGALVPFAKARFVVKVAPLAYDGVVAAEVEHRGVVTGTYRARARDGRAVFDLPLRGIEKFTVTFALPAADGLAARSAATSVRVKWRRLTVGSTGADVRSMLSALERLSIRTPGLSTRFGTDTRDAVMAFQKAYRLSRTYVFDYAAWRKLEVARPVKPRHASPSTHIEIDKSRQILMVVKNGAVAGLICVSTGATGNTPTGTFRIQQKHLSTSTFDGSGSLYRTMGFHGDFGIHGWVPVPPYPASHGCVREPMWVADWVYDQSWVGETVYLYY